MALGAEQALRLVTRDAARALGLEREIGSLRPGNWGDVTAFRLPGPTDAGQLPEAVLSLGPDAVLLTCLAGREMFRRKRL